MKRRISQILTLGLVLVAAVGARQAHRTDMPQDPVASGGARPSTAEVERAGEVFRAACLACHRVPDLRFELDRAWLGQVQDTA